jgi:hypothetical protein
MCCNGALFVEASPTPNMIDHNILWDIRGAAIYGGDTDNLIIAHNLVGNCTGPGVQTRVATDRSVNGRRVTSKHNTAVHNLFYRVAEPIRFEDEDNHSDRNVFANPSRQFDLAAWQQTGRDAASVTVDLDLEFDPSTLELHWAAPALPQFEPVDGVDVDYHNTPRPAQAATCGPFQNQFTGPVVLHVCPSQTQR